ncbi:unnamed protein product [Penicillium egyptiacum]|uniref:Uncharacterized protein n=1 Tax=Penicillium egyptiacum TaxID=1303716 RepID=A0A9W4P9H3_9EURO|nr:unnamed protein product [Penicillium egyptiacum]
MALSSSPSVFSQEQIRCLEEENVFLQVPQAITQSGKRKVSATFTPPRSSSSSSSSVSIETRGFQDGIVQTFDIPTSDESVEVLEFIGFSADTAIDLYSRYANRPDPEENPDSLFDYACGHLASLNTQRYEEMGTRQALIAVGLTTKLVEAILDPAFTDVFGTQSPFFWAKDSVATNYATLRNHQRLLASFATQQMARKTKSSKRQCQTAGTRPPPPSQEVPAPMAAATINIESSDLNLPKDHIQVQTEDVEILEDAVSLYKGKSFLELSFEETSLIAEDGSINIMQLASVQGGDFNWAFSAHYWTPHKETAEKYREWAAHRCPQAITCVIHIQVPSSFVRGLHREDLRFSPDWKEYVWTSRKGIQPAPKFDRLWRPGQAQVVVGPFCSLYDPRIGRIRAKNIQTDITADNTLKLLSGKKSVQWVFVALDTMLQLGVEVRGKMHLIIYQGST